MSQSTFLYTKIKVADFTVNNRADLQRKIQDNKYWIEQYKTELRTYMFMSEPKKFLTEEDAKDPIFALNRRFNEVMEYLQELTEETWKLELLEESWDECHDKETGFAIDVPEGIDLHTYITGDFIKTNKYPNGVDY